MEPEDITNKNQRRRAELQRLGITIARLREERNITQTDMATMLGYTSHAHVSRIESGRRTPSLYTLFEMADIMEVSVRDFFTDF